MGWFDDDSHEAQSYDQVVNRPHEAKWSHELLGGAAAFASRPPRPTRTMSQGTPADHARAKEILAGVIGAFVDREVETRGLDYVDKEKAKRHAQQQAEQRLANQGQW
uniref:Uncharacterized protein n=1 Tax=Bionectria ochroleuca TaxID=29856 RepID=A0A8H7NKF7_BIOOC